MMNRMDAELGWQLNTSLSIGQWAVTISNDITQARLHDLGTLEDLREIHNWDPIFTLRFPDGTTRDVAVGRPDDDGTFILVDIDTVIALEAAADSGESDGLLPEPEPVATTTTWLHQHGFITREHSRAGRLSGSRLFFRRQDGWRVRYNCFLGTWSLELSPPTHHRFDSIHRLCPDKNTAWHDALPPLIGDPPPSHTSTVSD